MEGQPSLLFKTNDKTIRLTEEGFISDHFVYNVRDGELCMLVDDGVLKEDEIGVQPIPEGVNT